MIDLDKEYERVLGLPYEGAAFDALSTSDRIIIALWGLEADVNDGGFHQYYFNSSGDQAFFVVEALQVIGAFRMATIVREANSFFGSDGPSRERFIRQQQLEDLTGDDVEFFDAFDQRFYEYPDDIGALLSAYLETQL